MQMQLSELRGLKIPWALREVRKQSFRRGGLGKGAKGGEIRLMQEEEEYAFQQTQFIASPSAAGLFAAIWA